MQAVTVLSCFAQKCSWVFVRFLCGYQETKSCNICMVHAQRFFKFMFDFTCLRSVEIVKPRSCLLNNIDISEVRLLNDQGR